MDPVYMDVAGSSWGFQITLNHDVDEINEISGFFFVLLLELGDHRGIGQRRRVAERLAFGDVAQQPAHDLARARLRQVGGEEDVVGPGDGADLLGDVCLQLVGERLGARARPP